MYLFDFTNNCKCFGKWFFINDVKQGGYSISQIRYSEKNKSAVIYGKVYHYLDTGFTMSKVYLHNVNLSQYSGFKIKVAADKKSRFNFMVQNNFAYNGLVFQKSFVADKHYTVITIPFTSFKPSKDNKALSFSESLDTSKIIAIGFSASILDSDGFKNDLFKNGKFSLSVKWIQTYDTARTRSKHNHDYLFINPI